MSLNSKSHVVHELLERSVITGRQYHHVKKRAQKRLFALSFRCYQEDEYDGIEVEIPEVNGQSSSEAPIYACKFGVGKKYGHILVLANEDGKVALRDTRDRSNQTAIEGQQIHTNAIYEVCWVPGTSEFVSVSGDQTASITRVRDDGSLTQELVLQGHCRTVKTVHVNPFDPSVIATGGRDGTVIVWDKRCKPHHQADSICPAHHNQVIKSTSSPYLRKAAQSGALGNNSVTAVMFQQQHTLISSGASDGLIKIWDLRKTHAGGKRDPQCQNFLEYSGKSSHRGFTCMSISPERDVLYTSCMDNVIYAYHLANPTPKPVAEYTGHINLTYFVKSCLSPCGSYLLSGSSDNSAYIWLTGRPGKPIARLTGHFAEVTSVGWCPVDDEKLVTCADDMKLRVFRRKNVNEEDFDERTNSRGVSEPYHTEEEEAQSAGKMKSEVSPEQSDKNKVTLESKDSIPPLPVTPSTSRVKISVPATPSSAKAREGLSAASPQSYAVTPKQLTPRQRHKGKGKATPCTPGTGERNTLLQWLASAKTPGPKESPGSQKLTISESKKANLKRKLTDFLTEDQENLERKKMVKSPGTSPKKVLVASSTVNSPDSPPPTVAKMLKYEDDCKSPEHRAKDESEETVEMNDYVKPIEAKDKVALDCGFRKPVTNITKKLLDACVLRPFPKVNEMKTSDSPDSQCRTLTPSKEFRYSHISSPTANLPNYILDGSSPHNRPEVRRERKKNPDWLTSFSHQRKLKFSATPVKPSPSKLGPLAPKRQKKILQIKMKPVTLKS